LTIAYGGRRHHARQVDRTQNKLGAIAVVIRTAGGLNRQPATCDCGCKCYPGIVGIVTWWQRVVCGPRVLGGMNVGI